MSPFHLFKMLSYQCIILLMLNNLPCFLITVYLTPMMDHLCHCSDSSAWSVHSSCKSSAQCTWTCGVNTKDLVQISCKTRCTGKRITLFCHFCSYPCNRLLVVGCCNPSCNHVHGLVIRTVSIIHKIHS